MPESSASGLGALERIRGMGPATHADPNASTAGAKLGPVITVSAASNAPTRFEDLYSRKTHKWNPIYVQPTEDRLSLHRTQAVPTFLEPVRWHLESEELPHPR